MKPEHPPTLVYCYDPMCSWCWGFKPVWQALQTQLQPLIEKYGLVIRYQLGGLAPDSDVPMPDELAQQIEATWQRIHAQLGTPFNFDFWQLNQPRRSTYPACRACLVARDYGLEQEMVLAIQQAYYLNAKNPSNLDTLSECAQTIGLDQDVFEAEWRECFENKSLEKEVMQARQLGLNSFPSLALIINHQSYPISVDYQSADRLLKQIDKQLSSLLD